jgi:hypothetical protein
MLAVMTAASAGVGASAESYVAEIYSSPTGFTRMIVNGAGDNALMGGTVSNVGGQSQAAYRTVSGFKIMHPTGWFRSQILDSWGSTYHCGNGVAVSGGPIHALFWVGGGAALDIHPTGAEYGTSTAEGGGGQFQAGRVTANLGTFPCPECGFDVAAHAGMWSRTAASFRRLHSTTHSNTSANATDGVGIVGYGTNISDGSTNALIWKSPTQMAINLRPSQSTTSLAKSIWGNQQVGQYRSPGTMDNLHAVLWSGTAASAVDLNPTGVFVTSQAEAVRNGLQVGVGQAISTPGRTQAIAWHGTAASWINLHARLPYPFTLWSSFAMGIDNQGNVLGYISTADGSDKRPVIWRRM